MDSPQYLHLRSGDQPAWSYTLVYCGQILSDSWKILAALWPCSAAVFWIHHQHHQCHPRCPTSFGG